MASITASSLAAALPQPKYQGTNDASILHTEARGPRVVGPEVLKQGQVTVRRTGPPPYGHRQGWRPRSAEDFGDGGAFPEIPVAQYPLDMGRKGNAASKALALRVDNEGKADYTALARQGHSSKRIVQASFKDLIPLRQRANIGEISLERPSEEEVTAATERTKNALAGIISGAVAAQRPKNVKLTGKQEPTYVRYTPAAQMGDRTQKNDRILKIVHRQVDPMEPPKFKAKKIPRGPPSPPAPVMHSPPRKLTAADQENWKIPPSVSNWKNPKGFTIPLDKRLAADGRGLMDVTINDKFAGLAESLFAADRLAREEVRERALMQQRLADKEKSDREEQLRMLARRAREEGAARQQRQRRRSSRGRSTDSDHSDYSDRSRSYSRSSRRSSRGSDSDDNEAARERRERRKEQDREAERKLRQTRMGTERRTLVMAKEQNRDISERIALGLAKPTQSKESMYDSRLFNQSSGFESGFNEDQAYDKPLFAARDAINTIYRPSRAADDEDGEDGGETLERIQKNGRFDILGKAGKGFKGAADADIREGPVQFEKDIRPQKGPQAANGPADPFAEVDSFLDSVASGAGGTVEQGSGKRRYGIDEDSTRAQKRARRRDDD